jgi:hypothetical protein
MIFILVSGQFTDLFQGANEQIQTKEKEFVLIKAIPLPKETLIHICD